MCKDAMIRCELVNFEEMSREEKLAFHLASVYEIIGVSDWEDITSAKEVHWTFILHRILNRFFKEIVHYPGEKWINLYSSNRRIIKVHSYFHGYSAMIEELMERGIIQVN